MNLPLEVKMVSALRNGEPVIIKTQRKPIQYEVDQIIGVKETWQYGYGKNNGQVVYKVDVDEGIGIADPYGWRYANALPERFIRYHAVVASVEKMTQKEFLKKYGRCISYNRMLFFYSDCKNPNSSEWFRDRIYEKEIPLDAEVYAITLKFEEQTKQQEDKQYLRKTVVFDNYYSKQKENIELVWKVEDGFDTKEEAITAIIEAGQDPEEFSLVYFKEMIYPISICLISEMIIISKEYIWYKEGAYNGLTKFRRDELKEPLYVIENARVSSAWTDTLVRDLKGFDTNYHCEVARKIKTKSYMETDCMIALGIAFFDTMIPVFKLNCVDKYFAYPPSMQKLWQQGIKAYNPFTNEKVFTKGNKPYPYWRYKNEMSN